MMTYGQIATATLDQLTDELASAGWNSCETSIEDARESVARLFNSTVRLTLYDSETALPIRLATDDEAAESANAGPEGHIMVAGRKCYVA
jgi:hypothetical protein